MTSTTAAHARDPGRVRELVDAVRSGATSAAELLERCLERIREVDGAVCAFRLVDADGARREAETLDREAKAQGLRGPLHGVPVAIKDIVDVAGLPTRCNSRSREDAPPARGDAAIVAGLRAAGAVVVGKAHTTEYAYFDPSPARNPHDLEHTPGGSSSGSAAAVAAGMVPLAIGTQTVASVNRPAAYCGIAAFKPSSGLLSTYGITPLAPLFDTPAVFGHSVVDAADAFRAIRPAFAREAPLAASGRLRIHRLEDPLLDDADESVTAALAALADRLAEAGYAVETSASPIDFGALFDAQQTVTRFEAGRALAALAEVPRGQVGPKLLELIAQGQAIAPAAYYASRRAIDAARSALFDGLAGADAFLWPAAPRGAPRGLEWTGDPRYVAPWTALGGPILSVPAGKGADGLPIGALVCTRPGTDAGLAAAADGIAAVERHG